MATIKSAKLILTMGTLFIILLFVVVSKPRIDLNDYEEECYKYEQIPYVANYTFPILSHGCFYVSYWDKCDYENITYSYSTTRNGECIKYHLVRNA